MSYVDGYLIPVPNANKAQYKAMAELGAQVFIDHGASHVSENWGEDMMKGKSTDFFMAVKAGEDEAVVFSWIVWPDKATRDAGNKAAMEDPRFKEWEGVNVFDGKRLIYSGFENLVDVKG